MADEDDRDAGSKTWRCPSPQRQAARWASAGDARQPSGDWWRIVLVGAGAT